MNPNDVDGMIECKVCLWAAVILVIVLVISVAIGIWFSTAEAGTTCVTSCKAYNTWRKP